MFRRASRRDKRLPRAGYATAPSVANASSSSKPRSSCFNSSSTEPEPPCVKWLEGVGQADLMGIDLSALWGTMKLELGGITGDAATLREMSELTTKLDANDPESARKAVQATAQKRQEGASSGV